MKGESILIVDDLESIRFLLQDILTTLRYNCELAKDGSECIKKCNSTQYDLIMLDFYMPNLNGLETIEILNMNNIDTSILMLSSSKDIDDVKTALKLGAYDYIFKPFEIKDIEATVKRGIERTKLLRENKYYQQQLEKKVLDQTNEMMALYADTLEGMVLALDLREQETGYHSYRVTEYTLHLATQLNLPNEQLSIIVKGALLHDIGKIGIPDSVLLKNEKLTPKEWEIMKTHPQLGYNLLKKINFLEESAKIVLTHHEWYDGNGYPNAMSGKDIPIGSRIFCIVDALDAMTSDRVYRKTIGFGEAKQKIIEASESQFDPEIIELFTKISATEWIDLKNRIETSGITFLKNILYNTNKQAV
ncbi:MAG: response regulator [Candidatus Dadabacteria bacterium]|nr:response regulator [Candidatus Dadabacteria bacterium]NIS08350.1 response regulator [Candidatus Dadabacteria bacterium]NIY21870.1 response regulator [Candidatus Dadabacteria bacterium]